MRKIILNFFVFMILVLVFSCKQPNEIFFANEQKIDSIDEKNGEKKEEQPPAYRFPEDEVKSKRISEYIRRIFQDKNGHFWFGTNNDGLVQWDQKRFTYYRKDEGIVGTQITGILQDKKGDLWVSTSEGVSQRKAGVFKNFGKNEGIHNPSCWSLFEDREGVIWIGSLSGLYRFNGSTFDKIILDENEEAGVYALTEDQKGNLWIGTQTGRVYIYDRKTTKRFYIEGKENHSRITSIAEDLKGNIWIGSMEDGIVCYDGQNFLRFSKETGALGYNEVWTIMVDKLGKVWFSCEGFGIYSYDGDQLENFSKSKGMMLHAVQSIFQDKNGIYWIGGGNDSGLYQMVDRRFYRMLKADFVSGC